MSVIVQELRGSSLSTPAAASWVGPIGCVLVDTDTWSLRVQDGVTPGGHVFGSVSFPIPTVEGGTGQTGPYSDGQLLIGDTSSWGLDIGSLTAGSGVSIAVGHGTIVISATGLGGTVTSVAAGTGLSASPGTITTSGTISLSVPVGHVNGGTDNTAALTDGQLLIGDGSSGNWDIASLTAGAGVTITPGHGSITISAQVSATIGGAFTVIDITSGNSATITPTTPRTLVVWRVAATGTKTLFIEGSGAGNDGWEIIDKVTQGNGDDHNIVPLSGTVEGIGTLSFTDTAGVLHVSIGMASDGANTDWVVT